MNKRGKEKEQGEGQGKKQRVDEIEIVFGTKGLFSSPIFLSAKQRQRVVSSIKAAHCQIKMFKGMGYDFSNDSVLRAFNSALLVQDHLEKNPGRVFYCKVPAVPPGIRFDKGAIVASDLDTQGAAWEYDLKMAVQRVEADMLTHQGIDVTRGDLMEIYTVHGEKFDLSDSTRDDKTFEMSVYGYFLHMYQCLSKLYDQLWALMPKAFEADRFMERNLTRVAAGVPGVSQTFLALSDEE